MSERDSNQVPTHLKRGQDFVHLYVLNERRIYAFIFTLVHDWSAAEDLLQETAQIMWSKFDTFKPGTDFTAWALCIARYQVLDYRKRCKSRVVFDSELIERLAGQAQKHSVRDNGRHHEALKECLKKLTNRDRDLLELRYQLDASVRSIAETLGWHTKSVYRSLQRIRLQLFQCVRRTVA